MTVEEARKALDALRNLDFRSLELAPYTNYMRLLMVVRVMWDQQERVIAYCKSRGIDVTGAPDLLEVLINTTQTLRLLLVPMDPADVHAYLAEVRNEIRLAEAAILKAKGMQFDKTAEEIKAEK